MRRIYVCCSNTCPYSGGRFASGSSLPTRTGSGPTSRSRCGNREAGITAGDVTLEPDPGAEADGDNDGCDIGRVEVAIEVIDGATWCIFRRAVPSFSLEMRAERPCSPRRLEFEDINGGGNIVGAS